ncbi:O-fucosyltransferase 30 [Turnera subulata]|uniref:O-fucosyltransferase 30 n=1 Tax=Turnera subulata TaxID=218843 RepID=A0A9Q0J852_9ROSI|nr:O-fucosyltransferase 30 [Turnera subulata]
MNTILNLHKNTAKSSYWSKKKPTPPPHKSPLSLLLLSLFTLFFFLFLYISFTRTSNSFLSKKTLNPQIQQCSKLQTLIPGEKFLWFAPHSGFSNQLSEFKNGIVMAGILNRTLIVPPVLDHHAVALGSCPKFRVLGAKEIRVSAWDHAIDLIKTGRYVSMADIIDISSLLSHVRVIDFRVFTSLWCSVNLDLACVTDLNAPSTLFDSLKQCGSVLSGFDGNIDKCLYAVDEDCRTTVWTYKNGDEDGLLDSFQPDEQLKKKKKISYVRRRRDVYKALGPDSEADSATVLAFGTLFTAPYKGSESYIDFHKVEKDQRIRSLLEKSELLPFVPAILGAGKKFAMEIIKAPFLCAQLRLLDGQFKNHWKGTFLTLKQKLESLRQSGPQPIHIFLMTDLPQGNWTGTYLGELAGDSEHFKLHFLREEDDLVIQTAKDIVASGYGLRLGSSPRSFKESSAMRMSCSSRKLSDVLLYIEESTCSCASLGFVGTAGSTIAESIELMRKFDVCSDPSLTAR